MHLNTPFTPSSAAAPLSNIARGAVGVGGLILLAVGLPIFFGPLAYQAGMGVTLPADPTLLSDMRAMAGSLIGFGLLLLAGALWRRLGPPAVLAGAILFSSYGLSRLISFVVDGLPSSALIGGAAVELLVGGTLAAIALRGGAR